MSTRLSIKRFFKSHIFRTTILFAAIFSTVFFPLVYIYPTADETGRKFTVVIIVFASLFELIAAILIDRFWIYSKLSRAADKLGAMAHDGKTGRISEKSIDNGVCEVLSSVNTTAAAYDHLAQVRKSFVADASHELRSPLTSVQGFLQAVIDGTVSEGDKEKYLKIALGETKNLNALINSMLDLSRLDSGKNPPVYSKFDIHDLLNEISATFEPVLIKKNLQINVEFAREECNVYADKDKIGQVITNLLDNAVKYSPAYSRIILKTRIFENKVYVTVRDFGYGISKKDQMLIWDTFYMSDRARSPVKTKGTGLGLSIVKKIIDEHNEVIWVESSRGAGATFIFTLTLFDPSKHSAAVGKIIKASEHGEPSSETE